MNTYQGSNKRQQWALIFKPAGHLVAHKHTDSSSIWRLYSSAFFTRHSSGWRAPKNGKPKQRRLDRNRRMSELCRRWTHYAPLNCLCVCVYLCFQVCEGGGKAWRNGNLHSVRAFHCLQSCRPGIDYRIRPNCMWKIPVFCIFAEG